MHEPDHSTLFSAEVTDSAVVTVLSLYDFMVYTGTSLPCTIVFSMWLQYLCVSNCVPQTMRALWSHGAVLLFCSTMLCQNRECCYCTCISHTWKPLCMWLFLLCNALELVTTVVWTHRNFVAVFLKFWVCDVLWHILAMTSGISWNGCMFLFSAESAVQNSPLHYRQYFIYRWRRRKASHNLSFHRDYVFVKNILNPLPSTVNIRYCYLSSYVIYFHHTVHSHVW